MFAPIALFVHSRLEHTRQTITALKANLFADKTCLYIFSDAARQQKSGESSSVSDVRRYISTIDGFLSVHIVEREHNFGLKRNIVEGLNYVLEKHNRVIVLEDDCMPSPDFIGFMNDCLSRYEYDRSVWHISGWSPTVDLPGSIYRSNFMSCWGWATWRDRWRYLNLDALALMSKMSLLDRYWFNIGGSYPFFSHLVGNYLGINNTWAIFWFATIFTNGGLCVAPIRSKVKNIGMDNSGTHRTVLFEQNFDGASRGFNLVEDCSIAYANNAVGFALRKNLTWIQRGSMAIKALTPIWVYRLIHKIKKTK